MVETQPQPTAHTENPTWITVYEGDEATKIINEDEATYAVPSSSTDNLPLGSSR